MINSEGLQEVHRMEKEIIFFQQKKKKKKALPTTYICILKQVLQQHHTSYTYMVQTSKISFRTTYSVICSTVIKLT